MNVSISNHWARREGAPLEPIPRQSRIERARLFPQVRRQHSEGPRCVSPSDPVRVARVVGVRQSLGEELVPQATFSGTGGRDLRVHERQQSRSECRRRSLRPEPPYLVFLEDAVAREYLVCAFTGEHYLHSVLVDQS